MYKQWKRFKAYLLLVDLTPIINQWPINMTW